MRGVSYDKMTYQELMKARMDSLPPLPLPFDAACWGDPVFWEMAGPGVCRIETTGTFRPGTGSSDHLYVATRADAERLFSKALLALCEEKGGICYFDDEHGYPAVAYELCRHRGRAAPECERAALEAEAAEIAICGAETTPEYFGDWTPPQATPTGLRTRFKKADRGVWFVEGGDRWYLAVIEPIAEKIDAGPRCPQGDEEPDGFVPYTFWKLEDCALALYELIFYECCYGIRAWLTSLDDLTNYICRAYPEYVRSKNAMMNEVDEMLRHIDPSEPHKGWREIVQTGPGERWFLRDW